MSVLDADGEFRGVQTQFSIDGRGRVILPRAVSSALKWEAGVEVGVTPLEGPPKTAANA